MSYHEVDGFLIPSILWRKVGRQVDGKSREQRDIEISTARLVHHAAAVLIAHPAVQLDQKPSPADLGGFSLRPSCN